MKEIQMVKALHYMRKAEFLLNKSNDINHISVANKIKYFREILEEDLCDDRLTLLQSAEYITARAITPRRKAC